MSRVSIRLALGIIAGMILAGCPAEPTAIDESSEDQTATEQTSSVSTTPTDPFAGQQRMSLAGITFELSGGGLARSGPEREPLYIGPVAPGNNNSTTGAFVTGHGGPPPSVTNHQDLSNLDALEAPPDPAPPRPPLLLSGDTLYEGTLTADVFETLSGAPRDGHFFSTRTVSIVVAPDDTLASIYIPGYVLTPDLSAEVSQNGDSVTLTGHSSEFAELDYSISVSVQSATYGPGTANVTLSIGVDGVAGAMRQSGTGTQTLQLSWNGATMNYVSSTEYAVQMEANAPGQPEVLFDTTQRFEFGGTLTAQ